MEDSYTSNYGRTPPNKHGGVGRQQQQEETVEVIPVGDGGNNYENEGSLTDIYN